MKTKFCFVQPSTNYKVAQHKHSLALTFPQLINDLKISENSYAVYVDGLSGENFREYISTNNITHLFITANTSTFPSAVKLARTGKLNGYKTVLGGIFASSNSNIIAKNFCEFDFVVTGRPDESLSKQINQKNLSPIVLDFPNNTTIDNSICSIICSSEFYNLYKNTSACYEITSGCVYACTYCSLRTAWKGNELRHRSLENTNRDLLRISEKWSRLKIVDDDILQSPSIIQKLNIKDKFSEIICSTRVDRINSESIQILKDIGVSHIILGVESFDNSFIYSSKKSKKDDWQNKVNDAISLCVENSIIARPVLILLTPGMRRKYLSELKNYIHDWKVSNGIEVFFAFFTPHPGLKIEIDYTRLVTNNLIHFDHLNIVYCPNSLNKKYLKEVVESYHDLIEQTESQTYNPKIEMNEDFHREYNCFFSK